MNSALQLVASHQLRGDGIHQRAAVMDEDEALVLDPRESFAVRSAASRAGRGIQQ